MRASYEVAKHEFDFRDCNVADKQQLDQALRIIEKNNQKKLHVVLKQGHNSGGRHPLAPSSFPPLPQLKG